MGGMILVMDDEDKLGHFGVNIDIHIFSYFLITA